MGVGGSTPQPPTHRASGNPTQPWSANHPGRGGGHTLGSRTHSRPKPSTLSRRLPGRTSLPSGCSFATSASAVTLVKHSAAGGTSVPDAPPPPNLPHFANTRTEGWAGTNLVLGGGGCTGRPVDWLTTKLGICFGDFWPKSVLQRRISNHPTSNLH